VSADAASCAPNTQACADFGNCLNQQGEELQRSTRRRAAPVHGARDAHKVRQPECFRHFRCIGAECEDTCCGGWRIPVDQETYEKYQNLPAQRIAGKALSSLVEINPEPGPFARIRQEGAGCLALHKGLCAVQQTLGESYLPDICSTYPRILNAIGNAIEASLQLTCPEAVRLILNDPGAMVFHECIEELPHRSRDIKWIAGDPDDHLYQIRTLVAEFIRERSLPLGQRIVGVGFAIDILADVDMADAVRLLEDHLKSLRQGSFDSTFAAVKADPTFQLKTVQDLVEGRLETESPRFLECYKDFLRGLAWTPESTMEELADRYQRAWQSIFTPFVRRHEHLLENFLISCIFRTLYPYGPRPQGQKFAIDSSREAMRHSFVRLSVHYGIVRTLLIGMAALHKDDLSVHHVVKLVQSYSRVSMNNTFFATADIEYLEKDGSDPVRKAAELAMD
jgi:lysine-N-methylase